MKQYLKPILLSGLNPGEGDDPFIPPGGEGSQIGGDRSTSVVNLFSASEDVLTKAASSAAETPIELPMADAAEAVAPLAPAVEPAEIVPSIELAPVDIG